ncbi:MAG: hypothetical protein QOD44_2324 [Solirubrobacteraceae bacterium]|nr:hypothetical protein [Solirubrobacteraceae bacterium]
MIDAPPILVASRRWIPPSWMATVVVAGLWLAAGPATPDLAAQVHRVGEFGADGFTIWDNSWYGGHHLPGYSLVFPALGSAIGTRLAGAVAAVVSAALFGALLGPGRRSAACWWFAVSCSADLLIGRLTYALGVTFGLAAITALARARPRLAAGLAVVCAATSPLAGLFLALAGVAIAIAQRRRAGLVMGGAAAAVVVTLSTAFPEGGSQPFSPASFLVTIAISAAAAAIVGPRPVLRWGLVLYVVAVVVSFVVPSPMGGNVTRLGSAFVAPALVMVAPSVRGRGRLALVVVLSAACAWQWVDAFGQVARGWRDPSSAAAYYQPLIARLQPAADTTFRVEVPFTRGHWESVYLARDVALARGWERQLDRRLNAVFYTPRLDADAYHHWLRANAVRYVALPDVPMDVAGQQEARLVRRSPSFLRPVWANAHWRLFRVTDALALASRRADRTWLSNARVRVRVRRRGDVLLRVHWTPYWRLAAGAGCLSERHGWTMLDARRAGTFVLTPRFSLGRFLERLPVCAPEPSPRPAAGA